MDFYLENYEEDLIRFLDAIGADVDGSKALGEFIVKHNKSSSRPYLKQKLKDVELWIKYKILKKRHKS